MTIMNADETYLGSFRVLGDSGYTRSCLTALDMVLSGPLDPRRATVLTKNGNEHLILLWECGGWPFEGVVIPTGFMSGYGGEGPRGFSLALCMLHQQDIPINRLEVRPAMFDRIDGGDLPERWQKYIQESVIECEMPIPYWVFVNHWELARKRRLWRVQRWRYNGIEWTADADVVDDFSVATGDKLHQVCSAVRRKAPPEICQHAGLDLRDGWIEFAHTIREKVKVVPGNPGQNDVKSVVAALGLSEAVTKLANKAISSANALQHNRNATRELAQACFDDSTKAMAEIIRVRFPGHLDPFKNDLIRPN